MVKPIILCIECSTEVCSVAVCKGGEVLHFIESNIDFSHIENITIYINDCLRGASIKMSDLSACAIGSGPGSYTGLRVAASTAKGICFGLSIPLIAVDSLTVLAHGVDKKTDENTLIVPMIDARRMEVYTSVFDSDLKQLEGPKPLILDKTSFDKYDSHNIVFCGNGAIKYLEAFHLNKDSLGVVKTSATYLSRVAYQHYLSKTFVDIKDFSPFYLKSPNITPSRKKLF